MVASAIGIMVITAVISKDTSKSLKIANTVRSHEIGSPIHAASLTAVKSTLPVTAATIYEARTPKIIGTILIIPLPQILQTITTTIATNAIHQFVAQLSIADCDNVRPIPIIIGPVTIGDNCLIGSGSVVLHDVPANSTVTGLKARVIKTDGERVAHSIDLDHHKVIDPIAQEINQLKEEIEELRAKIDKKD